MFCLGERLQYHHICTDFFLSSRQQTTDEKYIILPTKSNNKVYARSVVHNYNNVLVIKCRALREVGQVGRDAFGEASEQRLSSESRDSNVARDKPSTKSKSNSQRLLVQPFVSFRCSHHTNSTCRRAHRSSHSRFQSSSGKSYRYKYDKNTIVSLSTCIGIDSHTYFLHHGSVISSISIIHFKELMYLFRE